MQQQIAIIQCYIHHMKDVEVSIAYPHTLREKALLMKAYNIAVNHLSI